MDRNSAETAVSPGEHKKSASKVYCLDYFFAFIPSPHGSSPHHDHELGRLESSWRPASAEEGFEIVRRRLFEPLVEREQFVARDTVARAFHDLYRTQQQEFPPECSKTDYETRLKAAYPIHPEVFD